MTREEIEKMAELKYPDPKKDTERTYWKSEIAEFQREAYSQAILDLQEKQTNSGEVAPSKQISAEEVLDDYIIAYSMNVDGAPRFTKNDCLNLMKSYASQLSPSQDKEESDAVEFAEWIQNNADKGVNRCIGKWYKWRENSCFTTSELYQIFRKEKGI